MGVIDKNNFVKGAEEVAKKSVGNPFNIANALVNAMSKAGMTDAQTRAALNREKDITI
ncbi:MAG: hypothetical protein JW985_00435 [Alphaproteobacteria bacterium]|nr:hypothetical protein [Alphaproteobacteria bacterium]